MKKWLPWIGLFFGAAYVFSSFRMPGTTQGFDVAAFARLPVLLNGRVQPLDSVARNCLLQIRTRQSVALPDRTTLSASQWLLEVLTQPTKADERKVFRIDNREVLNLLKLPVEEHFFAYQQLEPQVDEVEKQAREVDKIEAPHRTPFQRHILQLFNNLSIYGRLKNSLLPEGTENFTADLTAFQATIPDGVTAYQAQENKQPFDQQKLNTFLQFGQRYERLARLAYPLMIPPLEASQSRTDWQNTGGSLIDSLRTQKVHPAVLNYAKMADAWRAGNAADFNQAIAAYTLWLQQNSFVEAVNKGRSEFFYQQVQAFYHALVIYVGAFILGVIGILLLEASPSWSEMLRRSAFYLIALAAVVHTVGLVYRMVLEGRPPVTNLYSSAIFIGWGAVLLGLGLEWFFRVGIGNTVASFIGFITLVIAHNLSLGGDTMEMMRAVLDSNFWLATHVVTVTLGYAATFVAGMIAVAYILVGISTPLLAKKLGTTTVGRILSVMVYGIMCFAVLFSFVGTVLGGIWADQSWGRFWGWDPKENGALLIVIWTSAYLHARWGSVFQERGLMTMAVFGNIVTAWSWFGVNMLGVGLHAYGFMDSASVWLLAFCFSQVFIIILGWLPPGFCRRLAPQARPNATLPVNQPQASP